MREGSGGSQCTGGARGQCGQNGGHAAKWTLTPNVLTSQSASCQLQGTVWNNFHYPSALMGNEAGPEWQRTMTIVSAHFEILLGSHASISCALGLLA